jgi:GT2 family glycosyltransferase
MSGEKPVLSILIVNFNSTPLLEECLRAIEASTIADGLEVIVVDNASADFDLQSMAAAHPKAIFLPQDVNTTFTGGNNLAFARASADLILMLNPDTRVEPEALEHAIAHMREEPDLAALSAFLLGPDGKLQRYYRRLPAFGDLPVMLFEPIFRNTRRGRRYLMLDESFRGETPVSDPPGAFILSRRSALQGRLLDPGYFNFVSDLELCERLGRAGRVVVFDDVRCHHRRAGAGVGTTDPNARLRLYHDYTWGLRRYFSGRMGGAQHVALNAMLVLYWATRAVRVGLGRPRQLPRAVSVAARALAGGAPAYPPSDANHDRAPTEDGNPGAVA